MIIIIIDVESSDKAPGILIMSGVWWDFEHVLIDKDHNMQRRDVEVVDFSFRFLKVYKKLLKALLGRFHEVFRSRHEIPWKFHEVSSMKLLEVSRKFLKDPIASIYQTPKLFLHTHIIFDMIHHSLKTQSNGFPVWLLTSNNIKPRIFLGNT